MSKKSRKFADEDEDLDMDEDEEVVPTKKSGKAVALAKQKKAQRPPFYQRALATWDRTSKWASPYVSWVWTNGSQVAWWVSTAYIVLVLPFQRAALMQEVMRYEMRASRMDQAAS